MFRISVISLSAIAVIGLVVFSANGQDAPKADQPAIEVQVRGLQVVGKAYGTGDDKLTPLNAFEPGVTVALLVTAKAGELIAFSEEGSKLTKLADDKGTNLLAGESRFGRKGFDMMPETSTDRKAIMLGVRGPTTPAAGANAIIIEGELAFNYSPSGKRESARLADVALAKGGKLKAGPFDLSISDARQEKSGDETHMIVEFQSQQNIRQLIAGVKFLDGDGKPIESRVYSSGYSGGLGSGYTYDLSYSLKRAVGKATVVIEYWSDAKMVKVPMNLRVGVGLQ